MFITEVKMAKFWKFLSVPIVLVVCLGLMLVPVVIPGQGQVALASSNVTVSFDPTSQSVLPGNSFTIDSVIDNPNGMDIFIHEIHFDFDPTYFTVDSVSHVDFSYNVMPPAIDNVAGTVDWGPSMPLGSTTNATSIISARINCTATLNEGMSNVTWVYTMGPPPRLTKVQNGVEYLEGGNMSLMHDGTVIVGDVFNLTVTSNGCCPIDVSGGRGTVANGSSKSFVVPCSENVTLTADESDVCCNFVNWVVDAGAPNATNPITVTGAANSSHTAVATCSMPQYNLTMAVNGSGITTPSIGLHTYTCGQVVNVSATADPGWWFVNWTGDLTGSTNPTTITVDGDKNVTANFVERFTLTMAVTGNGTTTPSGSVIVINGTGVAINATPDSGWHFVNWTTADMSEISNATAALTSVTVDKNKTVTAHFAINRYNLTINSTSGGNVTTPGEGVQGPYDHGTVVNLIAEPDADYAFLGWSGDNGTIADVDSSTTNITMNGNYSIMAHFGPHDFSVRPLSLTFTTDEGENPPSQTLEICNTGNGTLNWSVSDNKGWLGESPTSGNLAEDGCEDVKVSVDVAGMPAGDYSATITFTGSPQQEVPVSLHIESAMMEIPGGPAALSASGLSISPQQVEPGQDVTISINVANTGGKIGSYNAVLYINSVVEDSQTVSVAAGASKNVIFTVSKSQTGVYDVSLAGQSGQFQVVGGGGWFGGGGLGTGGIIAIVVVVIILIVAVVFILRGTARPE
jgi:hypothetical protein